MDEKDDYQETFFEVKRKNYIGDIRGAFNKFPDFFCTGI